MKIYSLYDKLAEKFGNPFVSENHQVAIRDFAMACKNENSPMAMFPNDIELAFIGDFDERKGIINANDKPIIITAAKEFVKKETTNRAIENKKNINQKTIIKPISSRNEARIMKQAPDTEEREQGFGISCED